MHHPDPRAQAEEAVRIAVRYLDEKIDQLQAAGGLCRLRQTDQGLDLDLRSTTHARMLHHRNTPTG